MPNLVARPSSCGRFSYNADTSLATSVAPCTDAGVTPATSVENLETASPNAPKSVPNAVRSIEPPNMLFNQLGVSVGSNSYKLAIISPALAAASTASTFTLPATLVENLTIASPNSFRSVENVSKLID